MSELLISEVSTPKVQPARLYRAALFTICFICSALGGTVSTLMSVYLPVVVKDLQASVGTESLNYIGGYINALFIFGWAFGGFSWGIISDKIGRKKALLLSAFFYGLFTLSTGWADTWWSLMICRLLSGYGVGGVLVISFTLISEVWPQRTKAIYTGILSIAFPVGIFSAGMINYAVASWREGFMIGMVPMFLAFFGIWILKESEKWLEDRKEGNHGNSVSTLFSGLYKRELLIGSLTFGTMLMGLWAIFSWLPTWLQSLITLTDGHQERGLSMMCLGLGGLSGGFCSGWLANILGVRRTMLICFGVCTVMSFLLFRTNTVFSPIIYVEIGLLAFSFGVSQGVLSGYIPRIFPTMVRSTATGFCFNVGRLFTGTAVLLVGFLVTWLGGYGNAIFIFSMVFIIGLIVVFFLKEKEEEKL